MSPELRRHVREQRARDAAIPDGVLLVVRALPAGALSDACRGALSGAGVPGRAWVVLVIWAVVAPLAAARSFRWE